MSFVGDVAAAFKKLGVKTWVCWWCDQTLSIDEVGHHGEVCPLSPARRRKGMTPRELVDAWVAEYGPPQDDLERITRAVMANVFVGDPRFCSAVSGG